MGKDKFWTRRLRMEGKRLDSRALLLLNLILMIGVFLLFNLAWPASSRFKGENGWPERCTNSTMVVGEWESPAVKDLTENERVGENLYKESPTKFLPFGTGAFLFTLFATHRTGPASFAAIGLGPKMMYASWSKPRFECSWVAQSPPVDDANAFSSSSPQVNRSGYYGDAEPKRGETVTKGIATIHYLPDKDFPNIEEYITVIVYCTFDAPVSIDGEAGELRMVADHGQYRKQSGLQSVEFVAEIVDQSRGYNASLYEAPFKYEYMYCGSPLYGTINPRLVRQWLAYHMRLLGPNSHFMMYDVGGVNDEVWKVLEPWVKLGQVSITNMRQVARYNTYNDGQFLVLNDCLFRSKTLAKWSLFFDLDEYIHLSDSPHLEGRFHQFMAKMAEKGRRATSIQIQQRPMSNDHCAQNLSDPTAYKKQWIFEKLVYRRHVTTDSWDGWSKWRDVKTIVQAKYVNTMGVHTAVDVEVPTELSREETCIRLDVQDEGSSTGFENMLHYYHYHGTINVEGELCKEFVGALATEKEIDGAVHYLDQSMVSLGDSVREFERRTIGTVD